MLVRFLLLGSILVGPIGHADVSACDQCMEKCVGPLTDYTAQVVDKIGSCLKTDCAKSCVAEAGKYKQVQKYAQCRADTPEDGELKCLASLCLLQPNCNEPSPILSLVSTVQTCRAESGECLTRAYCGRPFAGKTASEWHYLTDPAEDLRVARYCICDDAIHPTEAGVVPAKGTECPRSCYPVCLASYCVSPEVFGDCFDSSGKVTKACKSDPAFSCEGRSDVEGTATSTVEVPRPSMPHSTLYKR